MAAAVSPEEKAGAVASMVRLRGSDGSEALVAVSVVDVAVIAIEPSARGLSLATV